MLIVVIAMKLFYKMLDEARIISLIEKKDHKAFEELIVSYKNYVYSVIISIVKDTHQAEEATQDTFMKIYKSISSFNQESKLSTWIYRIAYRTGLDYLKKRKPRSSDVTDHVDIQDQTDLEGEYHQKTLLEFVKGFIADLNPEASAVMQLFYLQQKSIKEVQEITGLTDTNIKTKLFRSRKLLRESAKNHFNQEIDLIL